MLLEAPGGPLNGLRGNFPSIGEDSPPKPPRGGPPSTAREGSRILPRPRKDDPVKKGTNNRNRGRSSRHRAKLKQKHRRARRRNTGGVRSTYR